MKNYFDGVDYLDNDQLLTAASDIVENLRREGIKDTRFQNILIQFH